MANATERGAIYLQRKAARARLAQIQGMTVRGSRINNTEKYWPFAWEHATQCHNFSAYESLTQLHGHAISPIEAFTGDMKYRIPELREFGDSEWCQQTPVAAAVTWTIVPWHLHGRAWSVSGQIGHRELVGAIARTSCVSAPL